MEKTMSWNNTENIVKKNGKCWNRGMHKYCSYWKAKHQKLIGPGKGKVTGYRCSLFDEDKSGYASLPECNRIYGQTYDGKRRS
jgi:hypothetical protein